MIKISLEKYVELYLQHEFISSMTFLDNILRAEKEYFDILAKDSSVDHRFAMNILEHEYSARFNYLSLTKGVNKKFIEEETRFLRKLWDTHDFLYKLEKSKDPEKHINSIGERP